MLRSLPVTTCYTAAACAPHIPVEVRVYDKLTHPYNHVEPHLCGVIWPHDHSRQHFPCCSSMLICRQQRLISLLLCDQAKYSSQ